MIPIFPGPHSSVSIETRPVASPAARTQRVKRHKSFALNWKCGDASQFIDVDAFLCKGHFEAGAPPWFWKWFFDDWPSCSHALSARACCVPEQGLLWLPTWAVHHWDAGEAGSPQLSSRRGDKRTRWGDTRCSVLVIWNPLHKVYVEWGRLAELGLDIRI